MNILYITTISLTMNSFFKPHIDMLVREGHNVDIACNDKDLALDPLYAALGCKFHRIDFSRSPLSVDNIKAYGQLKKVVENGNYDIVHCHTPNASFIARLVCRRFRKKTGLKVFYTAHGFHFFKGAPLLNWLVYYPAEKFCSRFTDKLITINKEDYARVRENFHAGEVCYVPGVGINLSQFDHVQVDRAAKRREIGVPEDAFLLLSVGELNENKNQQVVIRALAKLNDPNVHYALVGEGPKKDDLQKLAENLQISQQVHLLGYRKDVPALNHAANVFCFPSRREGLGVAAIEAMACGLPIVTSNVHGINDYSVDGITGYKCSPDDVSSFVEALTKLKGDAQLRSQIGQSNLAIAKKYDVKHIIAAIRKVYSL